MAYFSGAAVDMNAVQAALIAACVDQGWSWNSGSSVLSKGTMFLRVQVLDGYLTLLGRTSESAGSMPNVVRIGDIGTLPVVFPLSYEVHVFDNEVYLVIQYSVDSFQWCFFGQSTVSGLLGTGMIVGATSGSSTTTNSTPINITPSSGGTIGSFNTTSAALFWKTVGTSGNAVLNEYVHHDLDGAGWNISSVSAYIGISSLQPLVSIQPNNWNSEAVLLPIRAFTQRPSSKVSMIADLEHARYVRLDNYSPGQVISIGPDKWKLYPWFRKNAASRDGGVQIGHTGTMGWAIRYEGP